MLYNNSTYISVARSLSMLAMEQLSARIFLITSFISLDFASICTLYIGLLLEKRLNSCQSFGA